MSTVRSGVTRATVSSAVRQAANRSRLHPNHGSMDRSNTQSIDQITLYSDIAVIEDWLSSVKASPNIGAFAAVVQKVKRSIFTPIQSKIRATKPPITQSTPQSTTTSINRTKKPVVPVATVSTSPASSSGSARSLPSVTSDDHVNHSTNNQSNQQSNNQFSEQSNDEDFDDLLDFDTEISRFATKQLRSRTASAFDGHTPVLRSIAPNHVKFEHGRWVPSNNQTINQPINQTISAPTSVHHTPHDTLMRFEPNMLSSFPADLDDIDDCDDESKPINESDQQNEMDQTNDQSSVRSRTQSSTADDAEVSVIGHRNIIYPDDLDGLSDVDESPVSVTTSKSMITISSLPQPLGDNPLLACSTNLADEIDVDELERLDVDSSSDFAETDAALNGGSLNTTQISTSNTSIIAPKPSQQSLHSRLLRRSLGTPEEFAFPADLDDIEDDIPPPAQPDQVSATSPRSTTSSSLSSTQMLPASRPLFEFDLTTELMSALQKAEEDHHAVFDRLPSTAWKAALAVDPITADSSIRLAFIAYQAKLFANQRKVVKESTGPRPKTAGAVKPKSVLGATAVLTKPRATSTVTRPQTAVRR